MYDNKKSFSNNKNNNYQNKSFDNRPKFTAEFIEKGFRNDKGKFTFNKYFWLRSWRN